MNTIITMKTAKLLVLIKTNRAKHKGIVDAAFEKYREMAIAEFNKYIDEVKSGKEVRKYLRISEPKDHTKEYNLIISMLEAHQGVEIEIDAHEYKCYVLDDWSWKEAFVTTNSTYTET